MFKKKKAAPVKAAPAKKDHYGVIYTAAADTGDVTIWVRYFGEGTAPDIKITTIGSDRKRTTRPDLSFAEGLSAGLLEAEDVAHILDGKRLPSKDKPDSEPVSTSPCAECGKPADGDDYLCTDCRV